MTATTFLLVVSVCFAPGKCVDVTQGGFSSPQACITVGQRLAVKIEHAVATRVRCFEEARI